MILVLRALGVGDLVTAVPALRGLAAACHREPLALAAPRWLTPLIDLIGGIGRVVPTDGLTPRRWDIPPPRLAVNLHGRGPESHRLLHAAAPGRLWAFASPDGGHLDGPGWIEEEHEVHRWCRLLRHYGVATDETDLALAVPASTAPRGVTIVHPGAKVAARRWPADRFAAVARRLSRAGHRDRAPGGRLPDTFGHPVRADVAGALGAAAPPVPPRDLARHPE